MSMPQLFMPTRRFTVLLGGAVFDEWTRAEVSRDLEDMAGKFTLEIRDGARSWQSFPFATLAGMGAMVEAGLEIEILIDGESVLLGWVNKINPRAAEGQVSVTVTGVDKTADLADCAATVDGPSEHENITIDKLCEMICKPYGLSVRAEADVGKPFARYSIDVGETALSAIEKGARQRGLLVTSDGRNGLVLTQSGKKRAGGDLVFPGNVVETSGTFSVEDRHSEYHVKGQAERAGGRRRKAAYVDARAAPAPRDSSDWVRQQNTHETGGSSVYGSKKDEAMRRRYRPLVAMGRTQLTEEGARTQADWMARNARGRGDGLDYLVKGYHTAAGSLWRPNELVPVSDSYQQVNREMLIAGVAYSFDDQGACSRLRLSGPEAYDTAAEGNRGKNRGGLDGTAHPLIPDSETGGIGRA